MSTGAGVPHAIASSRRIQLPLPVPDAISRFRAEESPLEMVARTTFDVGSFWAQSPLYHSAWHASEPAFRARVAQAPELEIRCDERPWNIRRVLRR
jgi:hypothetical protein